MTDGVLAQETSVWPQGETAACACPHCGHVDEHQIANAREWGLGARDGECSACGGQYLVAAKDGAVVGEKLPSESESYLIKHYYDLGDQAVTVRAPAQLDPKRAAIYMQFWAEEWFGEEKIVTNLGIAAALVSFYGCKHSPRNRFGEVIDMHHDRETMCPNASTLMADTSLYRDGLREFLSAHLHG